MPKNIEVEIRSFISKNQYQKLLRFFRREGKFLDKEKQTTYYFSGPKDLRIQKTDNYSKIWLKDGKIHSKFRQDIEAKCRKEDFENLEEILFSLGFKVQIKWFRIRSDFYWKGIKVSLDFTKGYGYIVELEKMAEKKEKEKTYELLIKRLKELDIKITPKKEFDKKFNYYKNNWQKILK